MHQSGWWKCVVLYDENDAKQECSNSKDLCCTTSHTTDLYSNGATESKCKLMLATCPESAHKKIAADRSSIFWVIVSVKVFHTQWCTYVYVHTEQRVTIRPLRLLAVGINKVTKCNLIYWRSVIKTTSTHFILQHYSQSLLQKHSLVHSYLFNKSSEPCIRLSSRRSLSWYCFSSRDFSCSRCPTSELQKKRNISAYMSMPPHCHKLCITLNQHMEMLWNQVNEWTEFNIPLDI